MCPEVVRSAARRVFWWAAFLVHRFLLNAISPEPARGDPRRAERRGQKHAGAQPAGRRARDGHVRERGRDRAGAGRLRPGFGRDPGGAHHARAAGRASPGRADFAFETTLSGLSLQRTLHALHASGYETHLVYLWLPDPETAIERVRLRVRLGGHDVPEEDVRRRFYRSIRNFDKVYRGLVSSWWVYQALRPLDDPEPPPLIARGTGELVEVYNAEAWDRIRGRMGVDDGFEGEHGQA